MKIVGFEANGALHLGVVEGDQVIDLQAVDKSGIATLRPSGVWYDFRSKVSPKRGEFRCRFEKTWNGL